MKVIITTSNAYHHCLPVFFSCYNRHWGDPFELVGYKRPLIQLPDNCTFVSLGRQRGPTFFSDDLARYFRKQPDWFCWLMEDSFLRSFDRALFEKAKQLCIDGTGRVNLTKEGMNREHTRVGDVYYCHINSAYRLSTMPSIWNKSFLLHYMTPGLSPWKFELQDTHDNYCVSGLVSGVITHNEGVRKHDITKLNLEGIYD